MKALMRWRDETRNQLPVERVFGVRWGTVTDADAAEESYDLTAFCTNLAHARWVAKYLISIRERVTHVIQFKTSPYGIALAPGDYIRCITEFLPYSSANNGVVTSDGFISSITPLSQGSYDVLYYQPGLTNGVSNTVSVGSLSVGSDGKATNSDIFGSVFTIKDSTIQQNVYKVEEITIDEDSMVMVRAVEFPCDANLKSLIIQDIKDDSLYSWDLPSDDED